MKEILRQQWLVVRCLMAEALMNLILRVLPSSFDEGIHAHCALLTAAIEVSAATDRHMGEVRAAQQTMRRSWEG